MYCSTPSRGLYIPRILGQVATVLTPELEATDSRRRPSVQPAQLVATPPGARATAESAIWIGQLIDGGTGCCLDAFEATPTPADNASSA